jgi:nucleotide-binding universal stress UspA family protein
MSGIVVGIDGSEGSKRALEWAAAEAKLRGTPLTVVLAWQWPATMYGEAGWAGIDSDVIDDFRKLAEQRLDEETAPLASTFSGLEVRRKAIEGPAVATLIDAAKDADLLVVGTRGHGGFAGVLLGSVSQQVVHHGPCPVVIVPPKSS